MLKRSAAAVSTLACRSGFYCEGCSGKVVQAAERSTAGLTLLYTERQSSSEVQLGFCFILSFGAAATFGFNINYIHFLCGGSLKRMTCRGHRA